MELKRSIFLRMHYQPLSNQYLSILVLLRLKLKDFYDIQSYICKWFVNASCTATYSMGLICPTPISGTKVAKDKEKREVTN